MPNVDVYARDGEDVVELELGGKRVLLAKEYQIQLAFLQAPNAFSITIGDDSTAAELMKAFPPYTPFRLRINGVVQFAGRTDGYTVTSAQGTDLSIVGRDCMSHLIGNKIRTDRGISHASYEDLARIAIEGCGIKGYTLTFDTAAQRQAVVGKPITDKHEFTVGPIDVGPVMGHSVGRKVNYPDLRKAHDILQQTTTTTLTRIKGYNSSNPIELKRGHTYYDWVHKEFERGGLFLRGGVDPDGVDEFVYVLGEPNGRAPPLYGLFNQRGAAKLTGYSNVLKPRIHNVITGRHAEYWVQGRAGGGKGGRKGIEGHFVDEEMVALGVTWQDVHDDKDCKSTAHATYLARRNCAVARRHGHTYTYPIVGHTLPLLKEPSRRAVVAPDVTLYVNDPENGIDGVFWIERVTHTGGSHGTLTEITLMRPEDLVFGDGEFAPLHTRKKKGKGK